MVKRGDIILMDFDPQTGHEQKGTRPALVVSNEAFNRLSKMVMVCPITNTNKGHPFHLPLDGRTRTTGVVMCDQARTMDITARKARHLEVAPPDIVESVVDAIVRFIEIDRV
jgi:mRNA interferase MazF